MSSVLFLTDTHVRGTVPAGRTDNYLQTILRKLEWMVDYANFLGVDAILHGGDLFDSPNPSEDVAGSVGEILKHANMEVLIVPGNHDLFGYQIKSLPHTKLGLLARNAQNVRVITREDGPVAVGDIEIVGQHYYPHIDHGNASDFQHEGTAAHRILVYHGNLLADAPGFEMPHTLIKNVVTDAHLILAGHYHPGWPAAYQNGVSFWNPGSMARNDASVHNLNRMPKILLIESTENGMTVTEKAIEVARPAAEVLTDKHLQIEAAKVDAVQSFKETLRNATITTSETNLLASVSGDIAPAVVEKALSILGDIRNERGESPKRTFQSLRLQNFQSHVDTTISFHPRLTAIVGESNAGKTAILRALRWATQNEPRGAGFIRTGTERTTVTLETAEDSQITRSRTASSPGTLIVNGTEYKGFARNLPPDLWAAHGMTAIEVQGIRLIPSLALQHDPPFLLSLSPGQRALALSPLGGSERIEIAIRTLGTEKTRFSAQTRILEGRREALDRQIAETDGTEERRTRVRHVVQLAQKAETMRTKQQDMTAFFDRWRQNSLKTQDCEEALKREADVPQLDRRMIELRKQLITYQQISSLVHRLETLDREQASLRVIMVADPLPVMNQLRAAYAQYQQIAQFVNRLSMIQTNLIRQQAEVDHTITEIVSLESQRQALIDAGEICPVCKKPLSEDDC